LMPSRSHSSEVLISRRGEKESAKQNLKTI